MINRIIMETVACLRSKCHLKQNLIPSWPWSFRHTSCIFDFRCKTKYTNKKFCGTPGPAYLAVLPVLVIFCPLGPMVRRNSISLLVCMYVCHPHIWFLFNFLLLTLFRFWSYARYAKQFQYLWFLFNNVFCVSYPFEIRNKVMNHKTQTKLDF